MIGIQLPELPGTRHSASEPVTKILWQVLCLNVVVAAVKIIVGLSINSISMLADGFHSLVDGSSNVIGLVGTIIAGHPPDENHPYGHHKYETFATLGIGFLLLFTCWEVLESLVHRLFDNTPPDVTPLSFIVMGVTILINFGVTTYETHHGKALNSSILLADAAHTRSDIFVSISVLISLFAVSMGWLWVDLLVALSIVFVIARTGWQIIRQSSDVLSDVAVVDPHTVEKIALSVDGVESCHKIRSRGTNNIRHLDLHIQIDGRLSLEEAHALGHVTQHRLEQELGVTDVLVHVEPIQPK